MRMLPMETFEAESCVRGYHTYSDVWVATVGEQLVCTQEHRNAKDPFAVAVLNGSDIVGHYPMKISRLCWLFIRKDGRITCTVTGGRQYSADLPQGGLEIPCILRFEGGDKEISKVKKLLK